MSGSGVEACRMSRSGRMATPNVREWSGGPPGCLGVVWRSSRMPSRGREALTDIWEWYVREALPDVRKSRKTPWMSESGLETLPYVREWSGDPPVCPGEVGRPSWISGTGGEACRMSGSGVEACRMSRSGRMAIPNYREWSVGPSGCPGASTGFPEVIRRPFQMSESGRKTPANVRQWSGGPPGC